MGIGAAMLVSGMLAVAATGSPHAPTLPDVAPPPLGESHWVAEHMSFDGLPMSLKTFASSLTVDELFHYYVSWGRAHDVKEVKRVRRNEWEVLAMKSMRHFVSVQARATIRGSEGTITVSQALDDVRPNTATRFPYPAGVKVVSVQQYWDAGFASEHISMLSLRSVAVEARAFSDMLARHGWQLLRDGSASSLLSGHVIEAQQGPEHARVTLLPDRTRQATTAIVIVWRKS